jgi:hypothetical protein
MVETAYPLASALIPDDEDAFRGHINSLILTYSESYMTLFSDELLMRFCRRSLCVCNIHDDRSCPLTAPGLLEQRKGKLRTDLYKLFLDNRSRDGCRCGRGKAKGKNIQTPHRVPTVTDRDNVDLAHYQTHGNRV